MLDSCLLTIFHIFLQKNAYCMILGYIVAERKLQKIDSLVEQVKDISLADSTKPILVVGWENAKKLQGYTTVLDRRISENLFWTFGKTESRMDFEKDLKQFYDYIYFKILDKVKYYYVDPITLKYSKAKILCNIIDSKEEKNIYIHKNMVYMPYKGSILGLSLSICKYCGLNINKILGRIRRNRLNKVFDEKHDVPFKLKRMLGNKMYAMPYFL